MANCARAIPHSRGGIFHSFCICLKTRNNSLMALSSVGNENLETYSDPLSTLPFRANAARHHLIPTQARTHEGTGSLRLLATDPRTVVPRTYFGAVTTMAEH